MRKAAFVRLTPEQRTELTDRLERSGKGVRNRSFSFLTPFPFLDGASVVRSPPDTYVTERR